MKRIGLVTSPLVNGHAVRGVGFYTQRLLASLKSQVSNHTIEIIEIKNDYELRTQNYELIHYPFFDLTSLSLPLINKNKTVVTVHDVIPLEFPEHYPLGLKGRVNLQLQKLALRGVEFVITDSYASVKSIHHYLGVDHQKIRLIYLAADEIFKPIKQKKILQKTVEKYHLPAKFVLYVGDIGWNKNIPGLIAAAKMLNYPVVLVGKHAEEIEKMDLEHPELKHLKKLDLSHVLRLGFVPDSDLVALYNLAWVYCQPSFAEGFGLPVLEALACDCPVACSNSHSLPEIGGTAVAYFDPYNVADMATAIKSAKNNGGEAQAKKFSWEKTAQQTIMVYQEVLGK